MSSGTTRSNARLQQSISTIEGVHGRKSGEWGIVAILTRTTTIKSGIYVQTRGQLFTEGYAGIDLRNGVQYPKLRMEKK